MENDVAHDSTSELCLLKLLSDSNGRLLDDVPLVDEHFFHPPHAIIFPILKEIVNSGMKMEYTLISNLLEARNKIGVLVSPGLVSEITSFPPPWDNRHAYYAKVNECLGRRKMIKIGQLAQLASIPSGEDLEKTVSEINLRISELDPSSVGNDILNATCDAAARRIDEIMAGNRSRGPQTGIEAWDDAFGGLAPGWFYALCARQGVGKTAMMEQMTAHMLSNDVPVCVFSCDMDPEELVMRMACRDTGVSLRDLERGKVDMVKAQEVKDNVLILKRTKFRLHNLERVDGDSLVSVCKHEMRKHGCKIFFLDHIQLIRPKPGEDRRTAISNACKSLRSFCTSTRSTVVVLAHLNRNAAEETARAHHVKESDDVLGDTDGLVMLHSDQDPSELRPGQPWEVDFIIGKNRVGPTGRKYPLHFNRSQMSFSINPEA